jgi:uncharacterized protein
MNKRIVDFNDPSGISGRELDELEGFLLSSSGLKQPMNLEMVDGFLTALIVGPDTVMPSDWLPYVWDISGGGHSPEFHTPEQASRIIGIIMRMMNSIVSNFDECPDGYTPLPEMVEYGGDAEKRGAVRLWCIGFLMGISIREKSWEQLLGDEAAADSTNIISAVAGMFRDELQIGEEKEYELWVSVPEAVRKIRAFWMPYRRRALDRLNGRAGRTPGRNEVCSCGSGKKYKKCCGKPE